MEIISPSNMGIVGVPCNFILPPKIPDPVPDFIFREEFKSASLITANDGVLVNMDDTNIVAGPGGRIATGMIFNGVDEYITYTGDTTKGNIGATDMSICTWVKTIDNGDLLIGKSDDDTGTGGPGWLFHDATLGRMTARWGDLDMTDIKLSGATDLIDGSWHHVTITIKRSTGLVSFYVDSVAKGTGIGQIDYTTLSNNAPLTFGVFYNGGFYNSAKFTGTLGEARVYDRVISLSEIVTINGLGL